MMRKFTAHMGTHGGILCGKLGPPAVLLLLLLGLAGLALAVSSRTAQAQDTGVQQCYRWDVANLTGIDADGLRLQLSGVKTVSQVYVGADNPLGDARPGEGYDAAKDRYVLTLGVNPAVIGAGDSVSAGFCTPGQPTLIEASWLSGTMPILSNAGPVAVTWSWPAANAVQVQVQNTTGAPITLLDVQLLSGGAAIGLDDLDPMAVRNLGAAGESMGDPQLLEADAVTSTVLALAADGPQPGDPIVLAVHWSPADDLADVSTLYVSTDVAGRLYMPDVKRFMP